MTSPCIFNMQLIIHTLRGKNKIIAAKIKIKINHVNVRKWLIVPFSRGCITFLK